mmetsp:Transcript_4425/g.6498  ORF Transcript_4425/g.6498 Transcript_4425/m.6498 type:complete len:196 (+) Transcript_4425:322-909(+)
MPLKQISLTSFEQRLKKLVYTHHKDGLDGCVKETVTLGQLQESFGDNSSWRNELYEPTSLLFKLITDPVFHYNEYTDYGSDDQYDDEEDREQAVFQRQQTKHFQNLITLDKEKELVVNSILDSLQGFKVEDLAIGETGQLSDVSFNFCKQSLETTADDPIVIASFSGGGGEAASGSVTVQNLKIEMQAKFQLAHP